ncbi:unnamed protein product [Pleuronectes platessa]|uniref:Uncharacterized protein n=1 Tax=Pleuronectes platessa TaxID=8262 RepID=A0A9N7Z652_PLEPL|nr:unnamed protein product [Pleuronectes platessa]
MFTAGVDSLRVAAGEKAVMVLAGRQAPAAESCQKCQQHTPVGTGGGGRSEEDRMLMRRSWKNIRALSLTSSSLEPPVTELVEESNRSRPNFPRELTFVAAPLTFCGSSVQLGYISREGLSLSGAAVRPL